MQDHARLGNRRHLMDDGDMSARMTNPERLIFSSLVSDRKAHFLKGALRSGPCLARRPGFDAP